MQYEDVVYHWYGCMRLGLRCRIYPASIPAGPRKLLDELAMRRNHLRNLVFSQLCPSTPVMGTASGHNVPQNTEISNNIARPASSLASYCTPAELDEFSHLECNGNFAISFE
ncbi:hypothetical protein AcW1_010383 [Taiwanofungus camphoratus]|nr:hypothetical protein AcW1_010383 [Antrodia cinnamomea]